MFFFNLFPRYPFPISGMRTEYKVYVLPGEFEYVFCCLEMSEQGMTDLRFESEDPVKCAKAGFFFNTVHFIVIQTGKVKVKPVFRIIGKTGFNLFS